VFDSKKVSPLVFNLNTLSEPLIVKTGLDCESSSVLPEKTNEGSVKQISRALDENSCQDRTRGIVFSLYFKTRE
jgi:hypothetical protein